MPLFFSLLCSLIVLISKDIDDGILRFLFTGFNFLCNLDFTDVVMVDDDIIDLSSLLFSDNSYCKIIISKE